MSTCSFGICAATSCASSSTPLGPGREAAVEPAVARGLHLLHGALECGLADRRDRQLGFLHRFGQRVRKVDVDLRHGVIVGLERGYVKASRSTSTRATLSAVAASTPAIAALVRAGVEHRVHAYEHDPPSSPTGTRPFAAMGVEAGRVFKTLDRLDWLGVDGSARRCGRASPGDARREGARRRDRSEARRDGRSRRRRALDRVPRRRDQPDRAEAPARHRARRVRARVGARSSAAPAGGDSSSSWRRERCSRSRAGRPPRSRESGPDRSRASGSGERRCRARR